MTLPALLPVTTDIDGCARCGHKHEQLVFMPLTHPQHEWSHWAMCPTSGEPIMLANSPAEVSALDNYSLFTSLCDADRVMQEIDKTIERGVLDARSAIGDARLNFGQPHQYAWLTLLEQSRKRETQPPPPHSLPAEPAAAS